MFLGHFAVALAAKKAAPKSSLGTMVNYVYDLSRVEHNHENYVRKQKIACSSQVRKLLKK